MKFMMLMIHTVHPGNKKLDPNFTPDLKDMEPMGRFNDEMGKALKIESVNGLRPAAIGARVSFTSGKPTVTQGPSVDVKEVLGGYWILEAKSKDEVLNWAKACPADPDDVIEIRQIWEAKDFAVKK